MHKTRASALSPSLRYYFSRLGVMYPWNPGSPYLAGDVDVASQVTFRSFSFLAFSSTLRSVNKRARSSPRRDSYVVSCARRRITLSSLDSSVYARVADVIIVSVLSIIHRDDKQITLSLDSVVRSHSNVPADPGMHQTGSIASHYQLDPATPRDWSTAAIYSAIAASPSFRSRSSPWFSSLSLSHCQAF